MALDIIQNQRDAELLARFSKGDRAAALALTSRLAPVVFAQAFRMLGDRAEAEEVTQESLLRLWKADPGWDATRAKITTWLYRVTSNLCIDRLRKSVIRPTLVGFYRNARGILAKAIQATGPLEGHHCAFDARQKIQAQNHTSGAKPYSHDPWLGSELYKDDVQQRGQDMANDEDGQIGRPVIGTVVVKVLAAVMAAVMHL